MIFTGSCHRGVSAGATGRRLLRRGIAMLSVMTTWFLAVAAGAALAAAPASTLNVPQDARLNAVRQHLQETVDRAAAGGLPAEMIVSKIREGLAKGIDATRIDAAAVRLATNLQAARQLLQAKAPGFTSRALIGALAEAQGAGVALEAADPLMRARRPDGLTVRGVEVLTDLSLRGYPVERSALLVADVLGRDPGALGRLPSALDSIRNQQALTYVEAVDALGRGMASADSLQTGYGRTVDEERRKGNVETKDKIQNRELPGKSELAPGRVTKVKPGMGKGKNQ